MKNMRILSGILLILGIGLYIAAGYIASEVSEGRGKIAGAQGGVDKGRELSQLNPYTKDLGDIAADAFQKKIDEGKGKADKYQVLANWLHGSSIVLFIAGIGLLVFSFKSKKRR